MTDIRVPHLPPVFPSVCPRYSTIITNISYFIITDLEFLTCLQTFQVCARHSTIITGLEFLTCLQTFQVCARHNTIITDLEFLTCLQTFQVCARHSTIITDLEFLTCLRCFQVCTRHSTIIIKHERSYDQRHQSSSQAASVSRCVPDTVQSSSQTSEFL